MSLHNQKNIEDMNFEELRQTVSDMRAELTKYKKLLDLYLEDAENSALGKTLKLENGKLKTQIKAIAGEIATNVTKEIDVSDAIPTDEIPTESGNYDTGTIYKYTETVDGKKVTTYYYYNTITKKWDVVTDFSLMSVFQQTPEGFRLKGDVVKVDGSCVLTDSLVFDSPDNPIQVQYSADGNENNWHSEFVSGQDMFMRLQIGATWSDAMKIVGEDGDSANLPPYIHETYIDSTEIRSPKIYSNEFSIIPTYDTNGLFSGFRLCGYYDNKLVSLLRIHNSSELAPAVSFEPYLRGTAYWNFGLTEIQYGSLHMNYEHGYLNISNGCKLCINKGSSLQIEDGATVTGLKVKFG